MAREERKKLRIALLMDSFSQPRWVGRIIEDIRKSYFAEIVLIVKKNAFTAHSRRIFRKWSDSGDALLWRVCSKLDDLAVSPYPDPFEPIDMGLMADDWPMLAVQPFRNGLEDCLNDEDILKIVSYDIDVALDFGKRRMGGAATRSARHGIWSAGTSINAVRRGGPPGFWEVMGGEAATEFTLRIATGDQNLEKIPYRSYTSTDLFSVKGTQSKLYWKSATAVVRKLRELFEQGPASLDHESSSSGLQPSNGRRYSDPTNAQMLTFLFKIGRRRLERKLLDSTRVERWYLAYKLGDPVYPGLKFEDLNYMEPPGDRFWADPFPVQVHGKYHIFMEEFVYDAKKAHISVIEMNLDGTWKQPVKVLERDYHLSYPFLFEWHEQLYMVPETKRNKTIELYRCVEFPLKWEFERVIIDNVQAVDATLHEVDGMWWLFCNIGGQDFSSNDELHVFYAKTPLGPWTPHRLNPVKSDVRSARPAGRLFYQDGDLYRPSQDCSVRMGGAIVMNRITRLTPDDFREEGVARIDPTWRKGMIGTHTINAVGALTVLDCFTYGRKYLS
ncbi:MAG: hypothetical protein ACLP5H_07720 [Desulfomonilaceae bacterium]